MSASPAQAPAAVGTGSTPWSTQSRGGRNRVRKEGPVRGKKVAGGVPPGDPQGSPPGRPREGFEDHKEEKYFPWSPRITLQRQVQMYLVSPQPPRSFTQKMETKMPNAP